MTMTTTAFEILAAMRKHVEGPHVIDDNGNVWRTVYLPAVQPSDMDLRTFAGYLCELEEAGVYKPLNHEVGSTKC